MAVSPITYIDPGYMSITNIQLTWNGYIRYVKQTEGLTHVAHVAVWWTDLVLNGRQTSSHSGRTIPVAERAASVGDFAGLCTVSAQLWS